MPDIEPDELWVDLGSTEYAQTTRGSSQIALTGMPSTSNLQYFTIQCDVYLTNSLATDFVLYDTENSYEAWRMRGYFTNAYPGFLAMTNNVTNWSASPSAPAVSAFKADGIYFQTCSSLFRNEEYTHFKIVFDRINKSGYIYANNVLIGCATITEDPICIDTITLTLEAGSKPAYTKNIKVAGFSTLDKALAWNGE